MHALTQHAEHIGTAEHIPNGTYVEALLFAIYYAAITTLSPEEVVNCFQDTKENLLNKFRAGTERALVNANFLVECDVGMLQALVIFLVSLSSEDKGNVH